MQSPFIDTEEAASNAPTGLTPELIDKLEQLVQQGLQAKQEAERQKALYDTLRDQACAILRDIGETRFECGFGKVKTKETKSGWKFSEETNALKEQVRMREDVEKRTGIAQPSKMTLSADISA